MYIVVYFSQKFTLIFCLVVVHWLQKLFYFLVSVVCDLL